MGGTIIARERADGNSNSSIFRTIRDLERIGDYAERIADHMINMAKSIESLKPEAGKNK